jgi:hypothetical protein
MVNVYLYGGIAQVHVDAIPNQRDESFCPLPQENAVDGGQRQRMTIGVDHEVRAAPRVTCEKVIGAATDSFFDTALRKPVS